MSQTGPLPDSDSEDERLHGYTPVLAEKLGSGRLATQTSMKRPESAGQWMKDGVSLYNNELFHDEDAENGAPAPSGQNLNSSMRKGPSLAAKRQQRLEANQYTPNSLIKTGTQRPQPISPGSHTDASAASPFRPSTLPPPSVSTPARSANGSGPGTVHGGLQGSYDPNEGLEEEVIVPRHAPQQNHPTMYMPQRPMLDPANMRGFLMQPGPKNGPIQCYIVRDKGSAKMYPRYMLFLEDGKRFLLAARKRKKQTTSNYIISLDMDDLGRDSVSFFGKVRANFVGTEFTIFDAGEKQKKGSESGTQPPESRQELGAITYQYNVLGTRGPRKMMASIPAVDGSGHGMFRAQNELDTILERVRTRRGLEEIVVMGNKPPRWNDELNAYCLNFNGRVTEASVKNFQLVADDNHNHVILQFGKIGKNTFTMDYQWPMSAFQAFAICISSFDNKLACE